MTYTIIDVRQEGDTMNTVVLYDFNGVGVKVDIPHFQPQSTDDVLNAILNRAITEEQKLGVIEVGKTILPDLQALIGVITELPK